MHANAFSRIAATFLAAGVLAYGAADHALDDSANAIDVLPPAPITPPDLGQIKPLPPAPPPDTEGGGGSVAPAQAAGSCPVQQLRQIGTVQSFDWGNGCLSVRDLRSDAGVVRIDIPRSGNYIIEVEATGDLAFAQLYRTRNRDRNNRLAQSDPCSGGLCNFKTIATIETHLSSRSYWLEVSAFYEPARTPTFTLQVSEVRRNLWSRFDPLRGGVEISGAGSTCTMGFTARVTTPSRSFNGIVTNAHCTNIEGALDSTIFRQGGRNITAANAERADSERFDAALFETSQSIDHNLIARPAEANRRAAREVLNHPRGMPGPWLSLDLSPRNFRIVGLGDAQIGDVVHKVGRTTGWTYGTVVRDCRETECPTRTRSGDTFVPTTIEFESQYIVGDGGDSGSPVFICQDNNACRNSNDVTLVGLLWGGSRDSRLAGFTPIDDVLTALSAQLSPLNTDRICWEIGLARWCSSPPQPYGFGSHSSDVSEGNGSTVVRVELRAEQQPAFGEVRVNLRIERGAELAQLVNNTVVFAPGQQRAQAQVRILGNHYPNILMREVTLRITGVQGNAIVGNRSQHVLRVEDDDDQIFELAINGSNTVREGEAVPLIIRRTNYNPNELAFPANLTVTVNAGLDQLENATSHFRQYPVPSGPSPVQTGFIVMDDDRAEDTTTLRFILTHSGGRVSTPGGEVEIFVEPSDPAYGFSASNSTSNEGNANNVVDVHVKLRQGVALREQVQATLELNPQGIAELVSNSVTIEAGADAATAQVRILGNNHPNILMREVTLIITDVSGGDAQLEMGYERHTLTVQDDDDAEFEVLSSARTLQGIASEGETVTLLIRRTNYDEAEYGFPVSLTVTVDTGTADLKDMPNSSTLNIDSGTTSTRVAFGILPDGETESGETLRFSVTANTARTSVTGGQVEVTVAPPTFTARLAQDSVKAGQAAAIELTRALDSSDAPAAFDLDLIRGGGAFADGGTSTTLTLGKGTVKGFVIIHTDPAAHGTATIRVTPAAIGMADAAALDGSTLHHLAVDTAATRITYGFKDTILSISETATSLSVAVQLAGGTLNTDLLIPLAIAPSGADLIAEAPTHLIIPAGTAEASATLTLDNDDAAHSGTRQAILELGAETRTAATLHEPLSAAYLRIADDDTPAASNLTIQVPDVDLLVLEGETAAIRLVADSPVTGAPATGSVIVTPAYGGTGRGDIAAANETQYSIGTGETTTQVVITIADDNLAEGEEVFALTIMPAGETHTALGTARLTVPANDAAEYSVRLDLEHAAAEGSVAEYVVTRSPEIAHSSPVSFDVEINGLTPQDVLLATPRVVFQPHQNEVRGTIILPDDGMSEAAASGLLTLVWQGTDTPTVHPALLELQASDQAPVVGFDRNNAASVVEGQAASFRLIVTNMAQARRLGGNHILASLRVDTTASTADEADVSPQISEVQYTLPREARQADVPLETVRDGDASETLVLAVASAWLGTDQLALDTHTAVLTITQTPAPNTGRSSSGGASTRSSAGGAPRNTGGGSSPPPLPPPDRHLMLEVSTSAHIVSEGEQMIVTLARLEAGTALTVNLSVGAGAADDLTFPSTVELDAFTLEKEFSVLARLDDHREGQETHRLNLSGTSANGEPVQFAIPLEITINNVPLDEHQLYSLSVASQDQGASSGMARAVLLRGGSALLVIRRPQGATAAAIEFDLTITGINGADPLEYFDPVPQRITLPHGVNAGGVSLQVRPLGGSGVRAGEFVIAADVRGDALVAVREDVQVRVESIPLPSTGAFGAGNLMIALWTGALLAAGLAMVTAACLHSRRFWQRGRTH